ncbi:MAG: hypothetical protein V4510_09385 [bacterium]
MRDWALAAETVATLALILISAKAHGRQIRLERERFGVWRVDFRADNDARVEALWRRDRVWFWGLYPIFLLVGLVVVAVWVKPEGAAWAAWIAVAAGWALCGSFIAMGLASSFRLMQAMKEGVPSEEWRRAGHRESLLWWTFVAGIGLTAAVLLLA